LISARNISNYFKSQKIKVSVDTILDYLQYSKDAFLIDEDDRYDIK
jgi:predicted AAA+ superfamily ATPase